MCAIVDNNVVNEVFGGDPPEAGKQFRRWLGSRNGRLVVGGRLLEELRGNGGFREWFQQNELSGRLLQISGEEVGRREQRLKLADLCASDDEHVLALAAASGARLLYTNDALLMDDFRDRNIVPGAQGRIYTTRDRKDFRPAHKKLLGMRSLCRAPGHG